MILFYWNSFIKAVSGKKRPFFILLLILVLLVSAGILWIFANSGQTKVNVDVTPFSEINHEEGRTHFNIASQDSYLYKSPAQNGRDAAFDFIRKNPSINASFPLFPEDFSQNTEITREEKDREDKYLTKDNIRLSNEHYFFNQNIDSIPVYNATAAIHVRNSNEIYAVNGAISNSEEVTKQVISEEIAIQKALQKASEESGTGELTVIENQRYYINEKLMGISDNPVNQLALMIEVRTLEEPVLFLTTYFISLTDGKILYSETNIHDALSREIYNCQGTSCSLALQEGSAAGSITDVNNLYTYFGNIYDYFFTTLGRDSYDGNGAQIKGYVNATTGMIVNGRSKVKCPNAFWNGYEMVFCQGIVVLDVAAHELAHAITSSTAGLQYLRQSGALNESFSDIFGSALDGNWDIGESHTTSLQRPLRSMSNPPSRGDPDKLSSSIYHCAASDNGGVHVNSGVINKTYYLMTDGGNFNGCTINGIGRDKSTKIMYKALTNYLTATSNFKDAYGAVMQSCSDLYGSTSPECQNVDRAMQATELDQQTSASSTSPVCLGVQLNPPTCSAGGVAPTVPPVTSTPQPSGGVSPTSQPLPDGSLPTLIPLPTSTIPTPAGTATPTPTPVEFFTCQPDPKCVKSGKSIQLCPLTCRPV